MKTIRLSLVLLTLLILIRSSSRAQDWPQWRGPVRDGVAPGFTEPVGWPEQIAKKWKVTVGQGDASPAFVAGKLYVFVRQEGREVLVCLDAQSGKQLWAESYDAQAATGPAGRHPGPRSSPAVAQGKVITYGVRGTLSCFDASNGSLVWRKDDLPGVWPRFFTASSPLVSGDLCVAQIGGDDKGGVYAYALGTGEAKWKWIEDGTAYSSPMLAELGGSKMVVALTAERVVGLALTDGQLLWQVPFAPQGRAYNAATPLVVGQNIVFSGAGRGTRASTLGKDGSNYTVKDVWTNSNSVQFNTPVLNNKRLFGIAQNGDFFCLDAQTGNTIWTAPAPAGRSGFGSMTDAGAAVVALTPQAELQVVDSRSNEFKILGKYKVADSEVYATPILVNRSIYIKDQDSVMLWSVE
jgi:outer membrane protein assembly factor BamB